MNLRFFVLKFWGTCQLRPAHVRKDTWLSLFFHTASNEKVGGAWERGQCFDGNKWKEQR